MINETDKNCNDCKHIDSCILELLKDNLHPDKYVCSNFMIKIDGEQQ